MNSTPFLLVLLVLAVLTGSSGKSVNSQGQKSTKSQGHGHKPIVGIEPLSNVGKIKDPRHYNYGHQKPKQGPLPDPVFISSSIRINNGGVPPNYQQPKRHHPKELNKRQIYIQDQSQYLANQAVASALAQAQAQAQGQGQGNQVYYSQPTQHQFTIQQDANGALYGTASPMQFQTVTALPLSTQNQGQVYLLQNGNSYSPLTSQVPRGQNNPINSFLARTGETDDTHAQEQGDAVLSGQPKVSIVSHADPNAQQDSSKAQARKEQEKTQQQIQYEEAQQVLQNIIKQQALQQTQQQRQHQFQLAQQIQEQFTQQAQQQAAQARMDAAAAASAQQHQQQMAESQQTQILLSPSAAPPLGSAIIQAQPSPQPQIFQIHAPQPPSHSGQIQRLYQGANGQTYIVHKSASQPETDERSPTGSTGHITAPQGGNFVIKHQTYVAGPGGQMFTVPVPVPADQEENSKEDERSGERSEADRGERNERTSREDDDRRDEPSPPHRPAHRPLNSFMRRVMEAFSVRGDASERVGTNIALPILASTGVFFGLGALAAGWYLSNANREVGILRRTGKPVPPGTHNVKRIRRQLPPQPHSEIDQATFFQTIIQQAIEKQQEQFDEPATGIDTIVDYGQGQSTTTHKRKPLSRNDLEDPNHDGISPNSKVDGGHGHKHPIPKKSWLGSRQALNFAKVAIPAIILGGAVIAIGVLIFGWYITGSNREIAFLEPSAYSRRRKRDLTTTALTDGWFQRILNSIHENPFESGGPIQKDFDPWENKKDGDTSKGNVEYHANVSDAVVAVSLAVVAFFSLLGISFAWLAAQNEKSNLGLEGSYGFGGWPGLESEHYYRRGAVRRSRSKRSFQFNPFLTCDRPWLENLQKNFELAQERIPKLEIQ